MPSSQHPSQTHASSAEQKDLHHGTPIPANRSVRRWNVEQVCKRDGRMVAFDQERIVDAIFRAAKAVGGSDREEAWRVSDIVCRRIEQLGKRFPTVEEIQDIVEKVLIEEGHARTAKAYILYRAKRGELRAAAQEAAKNQDVERSAFLEMFAHKSKLVSILGYDRIESYKRVLFQLKDSQKQGKLPTHPDYLGGNELATNIYFKKYYLKDLEGERLDKRPEDSFARLAAFMGAVEPDEKRQDLWSEEFYRSLYEGHFVPGGRVLAGAGDLYRLKTLANCFVSMIQEDNLESIYQAAYECARTYSYGGGIGVDISTLRPARAVVHNAADESTGAVSFMELYSLTTGLIGQAGRRGALMITIDIKHPDSPLFINVKNIPNWITNQIVEQSKMSGKFSETQLQEIQRQVRENTQVRHANISLKMNDEFMRAVEEQNEYSPDTILVYEKERGVSSLGVAQGGGVHYSFGIPCKPIDKYILRGSFANISELNAFLSEEGCASIMPEVLQDGQRRDMFGDFIASSPGIKGDFAIKYAGDFMLYFNGTETGEIKRLVKARELWDAFVKGNYRTAEPGLIFWTNMTRFSPSNYVGRPIVSTNPCGEIPLEDGGACNLGSINLSRFVRNSYSAEAQIDWEGVAKTAAVITRFLDNVVTWNETLNPLEKQRKAARETRRLGIGVMGIADMLNQLSMGYDSNEGIEVIEQVMKFIANHVYRASADLAEEKGSSPVFEYEAYARGEFFQNNLDEETKEIVRTKGLRNIALLSIAPTGSISNIVLSYQIGGKNFIGVSGGIEPIFALYYTRRSESFGGNQMFKVFHSVVDAYIEEHGLQKDIQNAHDMEDLKRVLPAHFFRTAHAVAPDKRVEIQGVCQQYIDHSISSTVNLSEDIEPEVISNIYLDAWRKGLKGITIYREGSRFAILTTEGEATEFSAFKNKTFTWEGKEVRGDDVISLPTGRLTTVYHALRRGLMEVTGAESSLSFTEAAYKQGVPAHVTSEQIVSEAYNQKEEEEDPVILPLQKMEEMEEEGRATGQTISFQAFPEDNAQAEGEMPSFKPSTPYAPRVAMEFHVSGTPQEERVHVVSVQSYGESFARCPACKEMSLKMDNGCNTCMNEECGYGQCEV